TDALKLRQCLLNLVGNAVKFTETGGVRLSSRLEPTGPEGGSPAMLAITVADTGPGIAPERVSEVFTAYARLRDGVALRAEGAGLGLAIVRGIVDLLGGALDVETAPGEGAAFTIRLPASEIE
ncbi:MAG: ATP-binding protein, partial [Pseudomonadota bacterium]